jgi:1,4-dihydroxy-2-naphthoate octaprenyltransferase
MAQLALWLKAARLQFLTGSVMPVLVCGALAWHDTGEFHFGLWLLTLLGMVLVHSGANLANDFFDHLSGNDEANVDYFNPFTGGSRVIQEGSVHPLLVLAAAFVCLGAGSAIGLYLVWARGLFILLLGLIGVGTAFFYTAPPLKLAYRGLGELCIALDFGFLPALGAYYVQTQEISWAPVVGGLPSTLLITAILFINQFQDMRADAWADKRNWVVRLGRAKARYWFYAMIAGAPVSLAVGVILGWLPNLALLGLGACALLPKTIAAAERHHDDPALLGPANVGTVAMHLLTGVLMTIGLVVAGPRG